MDSSWIHGPACNRPPSAGGVTAESPLSRTQWTLQDDTEGQCFQTLPSAPRV